MLEELLLALIVLFLGIVPLVSFLLSLSRCFSCTVMLTPDPFADTGDSEAQASNYIHIRIQQRNGRKTLTTVQGVPNEYDLKKILKVLKKDFACNGHIVNDDDLGQIIQLQGDQRVKVSDFLTGKLQLPKKNIKIHGF